MKIALVSDSHGKARRLGRAIAMLIGRGAEVVVHCGDLGSADCVRVLGESGVPAYAVAGNMDRHVPLMAEMAAGSGVAFGLLTVEVDLGDGRHLVATHGDDDRVVGELLAGQQFAFFCHGHTHVRHNGTAGKMQIINPGAVHRASPHSAALLDTDTGAVEFIDGF